MFDYKKKKKKKKKKFDLIAIQSLKDHRKSKDLFLLHKQNIAKYITKFSLLC